MEKVCVSAWGLPKILEERLKEKYGDDWEKHVKTKAINEEELEEQVKAKAKEQQKTQRERRLNGFLKKLA
ncbi:competence domain protein [Helicobacter pylori Hp H-6]|uniref:Competence domain protein n=1 Tax=Helicobacter pylori Hp H-6 TaxID=992061 RepID=J0N403_HELPX|nr:competence domain protein [Helicobacter pylori Hp H-6]